MGTLSSQRDGCSSGCRVRVQDGDPRKDQGWGWVTKGNGFCRSFAKDETFGIEPLSSVWDLGAGAGVGPPRSPGSAPWEPAGCCCLLLVLG